MQKPTLPPTIYTYDLTPVRNYDRDSDAQRNNAWAEMHLTAALQGIVNRGKPRLYVLFVTTDKNKPGNIDQFWFDQMRASGWIASNPVQPIGSLEDLAGQFRSLYKGVVLYDLHVPATSNVASTVAGCDDLLPVPYDTTPGSVYERLVAGGPRLPVKVRLVQPDGSPMFTGSQTGSAKCDAYLWAKAHYMDTGKCDPRVMAYYPDSWCLSGGLTGEAPPYDRLAVTNHDYFISRRAFFFDLSPWDDERPQDDPSQPTGADYRTLRLILQSANDRIVDDVANHQSPAASLIDIGGSVPWAWKYTSAATKSAHDPADAQARFVAEASCYNACLDADGSANAAMANASFFCHYPLKPTYAQRHPCKADWISQGYIDKNGKALPWIFVTLYNGDYDSAAGLYEALPAFWNDPARGTMPMGWSFNPNLAQRFPLGFDWMRRTATGNDLFLAGASGAGSVNAGYLDGARTYSGLASALPLWEQRCTEAYRKFDISATGLLADGSAPQMSSRTMAAYARFSPGGVTAEKVPSPMGLIPGTRTPYIQIGPDLQSGDKADQALDIVKGDIAGDLPGAARFHVYRTHLWTPSQLVAFSLQMEKLGKVTVVDPYTFMGLLSLSLSQR